MVMMIDGIEQDTGSYINFGGGGGIPINSAPVALVGSNSPTQQFDLTALAGLRPQDKYLGRNRVSDITEAYQTYISGSAVGRGGQYAADAARKYGTTLTEAARGYLVAVGLPTLANALPNTNGSNNGGNNGGSVTPDPVIEQIKDTQKTIQEQIKAIQDNLTNNPFKVLSDQLSGLFGNAVYNPPLQSQATGYTPVTTSSPVGSAASGSSGIGLFIILGVLGVVAYFVYKRYAS